MVHFRRAYLYNQILSNIISNIILIKGFCGYMSIQQRASSIAVAMSCFTKND